MYTEGNRTLKKGVPAHLDEDRGTCIVVRPHTFQGSTSCNPTSGPEGKNEVRPVQARRNASG